MKKATNHARLAAFLYGGERGIRTLAPVTPTYTLSRGAPSAKLGYFSMPNFIIYMILHLAEREGFEPPAPCGVTGFQDQLHKPLGHLSALSLIIQLFRGWLKSQRLKFIKISALCQQNIDGWEELIGAVKTLYQQQPAEAGNRWQHCLQKLFFISSIV